MRQLYSPFLPHLIQSQISLLPVGVEGLQNAKTASGCQGAQFLLAQDVDVTQPVPSVPPIQQVIAFLDRLGGDTRQFPGLDARPPARAVQEVPVGMEEKAIGKEQPSQGADYLQAGCKPRKMVQHRKGEGVPKGRLPQRRCPPRGAEVSLKEARPQGGSLSPARLIQEGKAEIHAHIGAAVSIPGQAARQFPVAAAHIQHRSLSRQTGHQTRRAGLDALPRG